MLITMFRALVAKKGIVESTCHGFCDGKYLRLRRWIFCDVEQNCAKFTLRDDQEDTSKSHFQIRTQIRL